MLLGEKHIFFRLWVGVSIFFFYKIVKIVYMCLKKLWEGEVFFWQIHRIHPSFSWLVKKLFVFKLQVLVFEDAPNGVEAAHAAGMQCVWTPHKGINTQTHQHLATLVLDSLTEFKPEMFGLPPYDSWCLDVFVSATFSLYVTLWRMWYQYI